MSSHTASTINSVSVPRLLEWWQQQKLLVSVRSSLQNERPKADDVYIQAYCRLMEVYSVVKSGGVQAQKEAVRAFAQRESLLLHQRLAVVEAAAQLAESEKQSETKRIRQELSELHSANNWRIQTLTNIDPAEEAIVKYHLSDIERTFVQANCA